MFQTTLIINGDPITFGFKTPFIIAQDVYDAIKVDAESYYIQLDTKIGSTWVTRLITDPCDIINLRREQRITVTQP